MPFWSPDGRSLGFFSDGRLRVLDLTSGAVRSLCTAPSAQGGTWGANDAILFVPERSPKLFRTSATGGNCTLLKTLQIPAARWIRPQFLGDGEHFVVSSSWEAWLGSVRDDSLSLLVQFDGTSQQAVVGLPDYLLFTPPGAERQSFHAQRIDVAAKRLVGPIVPLFRAVTGGGGRTAMMTSGNGTMLVELAKGGGGTRVARFENGAWRDTSSAPFGTFRGFRASDDGRRLVMGGFRISVLDVRRNLWTDVLPMETPPKPTWGTIWSPSDTAVAFVAGTVKVGSSDRTIRRFSTDSSGRAYEALDWSPDGRHIAFLYEPAGGALFSEIWVLDVSTGARQRMFDETSSVDLVRFAPNSRRVVYEMNDGLYVRPFPGPGVAVRVMQEEGHRPAWSADGRSLYFEDARGNIDMVPVSESGEATAAPTIVVSRERIEALRPAYQEVSFDVARGTNDLFVVVGGNRRHTLTLVQDWPSLLAKRQ